MSKKKLNETLEVKKEKLQENPPQAKKIDEVAPPIKKGRPKMTEEEKIENRKKLAEKKLAKENMGTTLISDAKKLNSKIKSYIHILSSKEVERLKSVLVANFNDIDIKIAEKQQQEKKSMIIAKSVELEEAKKLITKLETELVDLHKDIIEFNKDIVQ